MVDAADYTALITSEHSSAPRFVATVALSCQGATDTQNTLLSLPDAYDVDQAVGVQLDAVGLWVGVSRTVSEPISGVYFSFGVAGLGWSEGVWQGPFDPTSGLIRLDDGTYRLVIKARILANNWDGTIAGAMPALQALFVASPTPGTLLFIQDNLDMSMSFVIAGQWPTALFTALLVNGELGIKPAGVRVSYKKASVSGSPVFGFGIENPYVSGWGVGAWAIDA